VIVTRHAKSARLLFVGIMWFPSDRWGEAWIATRLIAQWPGRVDGGEPSLDAGVFSFMSSFLPHARRRLDGMSSAPDPHSRVDDAVTRSVG